MGSALEKRVRKLEQAIGQAPCDNPGHDQLFIFWIDEEKSEETKVKGTEHEGEFMNARSQSRVLGQFNQNATDDARKLSPRHPLGSADRGFSKVCYHARARP